MPFRSRPKHSIQSPQSHRSSRLFALGLATLAAIFPLISEAVVLAVGDGTGNTTAPVDDPGFSNVGNRGVYLGNFSGNHWVITAAHVGAGSVVFDGISYNQVADSAVRVKNPTGMGLSQFTDLTLFRIDSDPSLPNLTISSSAPPIGSSVTLIGDGLDRETSLTSWKVDTGVTPFTWEEGGIPANASGYKPLETRTKRWGTNVTISPGANDVVNAGFGDSKSINLSFDSNGGTNEATVANGDSGGGLFYKNGVNWELSGILQATGTFSGQPSNTSVFGNLAFAGDLSFYRDEIQAITAVPEPHETAIILALFAVLWSRFRRQQHPQPV